MIWKLGQESAGALARKKSISMKQKLKNLWEIEKMLQKSRTSSIFFPPHLQVTVTSTLYGMRWWSAGLLPQQSQFTLCPWMKMKTFGHYSYCQLLISPTSVKMFSFIQQLKFRKWLKIDASPHPWGLVRFFSLLTQSFYSSSHFTGPRVTPGPCRDGAGEKRRVKGNKSSLGLAALCYLVT